MVTESQLREVQMKPPLAGTSEGLKIRGCQYFFGGRNLPPLVEIGLTDLQKFEGACALPAPSFGIPAHQNYIVRCRRLCARGELIAW